MRFNRVWPVRVRLSRRGSAGLGAALLGVLAVIGVGFAPAQADQPANPFQPTGKTWKATIYNATPYVPYVNVFDVMDPTKASDLNTPGLKWYMVLPFAGWVVDCKYWHPAMGWMYRGTQIQGIDDAGGPKNGYYETGFLAAILEGGLYVDDLDEICFPGGDKPATTS